MSAATADPRTRRRALAQEAEEEAREALEVAKGALEAEGEERNLTQAMDALRKAWAAHGALLLHGGELRNDFTRRATLAMADHLRRDVQVLWDRALLEVHTLEGASHG